jgi:hypothetical protein
MMMSHGVGMLLLTAVAGYWVLERASTHKGQLQKVGFAVGSLILVISLLGMICSVWCMKSGSSGMCPFGGKMGRGDSYRSGMPGSPK